MRTESLKVHQERRSLFTTTPSSSSGAAGQAASGLGRNSSVPLFPTSGVKGNLQGDSARSGLPSEQQPLLQPAQQQQQLLAPQDGYLTSRAEALQNVESTIVELGGIFQQLAQMVQEQGEMAARIDENVDDTLANVDSAQAQLLRYLNSISSNRWLLLKIFFVLMVFLVIFVVFVA
ncbi:hypothetical protein WJX72_012432 [[Myrmecia] bisecta]|uniref:t-SNARE coiled-coil homology domain-containing protein n=1 Tax=[Myrmecia] bisecta TaxID=41462 RepID=A0AAW1PNX3_9CHLO